MRLIDADKFKKEFIRYYGLTHSGIIDMIDNTPTVEPEIIHQPTSSEFKRMAVQLGYVKQEKGEWISTSGYDKCSVCGGLELGQTKFCPHCGARLIVRGEQI